MPKKTDHQKQSKKDQILVAAKHIFAQNGYCRSRIDQIANYLGLAKGTIYTYFPSKKALFVAVFEQGIYSLLTSVSEIEQEFKHPQVRLQKAVRKFFEFFESDHELIEILMQVRSEFKQEYRRIHMALYHNYIVKIQNDLRTGVDTGIFREMDVENTAEAISETLLGVLQSFYVRQYDVDDTVKNTYSQSSNHPSHLQNISEKKDYRRTKKTQSLAKRAKPVTELLLKGILKTNNP